MRNNWIVLLLLLVACQQPASKKDRITAVSDPLVGNWQFLDKYGNYNEAFFSDTLYQTYNKFVDRKVLVPYFVRNDSLHSVIDLRTEKREIVAGLNWIDGDHVVISTEFVSDTLSRMKGVSVTLQDTDPFTDSLAFAPAFRKRHEDYLVLKGIVTREEIEAFRERKEIPEDVLQQQKNR